MRCQLLKDGAGEDLDMAKQSIADAIASGGNADEATGLQDPHGSNVVDVGLADDRREG